jgi:hypothetical protein
LLLQLGQELLFQDFWRQAALGGDADARRFAKRLPQSLRPAASET